MNVYGKTVSPLQLLDADDAVSDSLRVDNHYTDGAAKVEIIHANGKALLANQYQLFIDEMSAFAAANSRFSDLFSFLSIFGRMKFRCPPVANNIDFSSSMLRCMMVS